MLPSTVTICEVGPRDGFQYVEKPIPTRLKVDLIEKLAKSGLSEMQVASFVHPKRVPQMADAEEVVGAIQDLGADLILTGLALNPRGVERALAAGIRHIDLSIATNENQSRSNANRSLDQAMQDMDVMIDVCLKNGAEPRAGLQTVFGYDEPGDTDSARVADMAGRLESAGAASISLADTTGMANPVSIAKIVEDVRQVVRALPLCLHLHDTRGAGLANVLAGLQCGITRFDTAFGGLGGCPFIDGAAGNIATEDTVLMLEAMGVRTGIDPSKIAIASRTLSLFLEEDLSGKVYSLLS